MLRLRRWGKYTRWFLAAFFLVFGIAALISGGFGSLLGLLWIAIGLLALKPIQKRVKSRYLADSEYPNAVLVLVIVTLFILSSGVSAFLIDPADTGHDEESSVSTPAEASDSVDAQSESTSTVTETPKQETVTETRAAETPTATRTPTVTPTPTPTETPTPEPDRLYISGVHADADGNDHDNLNGEYIQISRQGSELDLSGWTISDDSGHDYTVPSGVTISDGETITLYTGSGQDSETALYWGSGSAIWNNNGDVVYVEDDSGDTVIEYDY